jgi:hypothetical protein
VSKELSDVISSMNEDKKLKKWSHVEELGEDFDEYVATIKSNTRTTRFSKEEIAQQKEEMKKKIGENQIFRAQVLKNSKKKKKK